MVEVGVTSPRYSHVVDGTRVHLLALGERLVETRVYDVRSSLGASQGRPLQPHQWLVFC